METRTKCLTLDRRKAAALLGIHPNTLDKCDIPNIKIGSKKLFRKEVLYRWLADKERERTEERKKRGRPCGT